jgi:nitroreductase
MTAANHRTADHPIETVFLERWSPRAFTGEVVPAEALATMLEAARWAPSSYNAQPWRFLYARKGTPHWETFLSCLTPFNQSWAKNGGALVFVVSKTHMQVPNAPDPVPSHTHSFDAGAAWANLALQASHMGWHTHGMAGIEMEKIKADLHVPAGYRVEAGIVIGRIGEPSHLPEALAAREFPSPRESLEVIALEGGFPA